MLPQIISNPLSRTPVLASSVHPALGKIFSSKSGLFALLFDVVVWGEKETHSSLFISVNNGPTPFLPNSGGQGTGAVGGLKTGKSPDVDVAQEFKNLGVRLISLSSLYSFYFSRIANTSSPISVPVCVTGPGSSTKRPRRTVRHSVHVSSGEPFKHSRSKAGLELELDAIGSLLRESSSKRNSPVP